MEERRYPLRTIIADRLTCRSIVLAILLAITLIPAFHSAVFADENPPAGAKIPAAEIPGTKVPDAKIPDAKIPDAKTFDLQVRPFLARHCQGCHGGEKPKGKFRVETLTADFADEANRERWRTVVKRVRAGEMPPKEKPRPPDDEVRTLSDWVGSQADSAEAGRHGAQGRVLLRRLNRIEYENTVRDLLGIDADLKELLPIDSSANGFDNNSEAQHVSSFLMDRCATCTPAAGSSASTPAARRARWTRC
jgi:mono/diheme cytochrome c family protein